MIANSKYNLLDRAFTFGKNAELLQLVEVVIDGISIDFTIKNDGDIVPEVSYKIRTPLYADDWFVTEEELFLTIDDFTEAMSKLFEMRKFNYPKPLQTSEFNQVA